MSQMWCWHRTWERKHIGSDSSKSWSSWRKTTYLTPLKIVCVIFSGKCAFRLTIAFLNRRAFFNGAIVHFKILVTIGKVIDSERRILVSRYVGERYYDEKEALGPLPDALKVRTIAVGYP